MVHDDETWPAQLERVLLERGHQGVEVWNMGVSGYVHRQKRALIPAWAQRVGADLVLLQLYNTGPRLHLLTEEGRLQLAENQALWEEDMLWVPEGGVLVDWLWRHWRLGRLGVVLANLPNSAFSPDLEVGGEVEAEWNSRDRAERARLLQAAENTRLPWLSVMIPAAAESAFDPGEEGKMLDLRSLLRPFSHVEGINDLHPSAEVYGLYAEAISDELGRRGMLPPSAF
jgi:lysophospholipase L1-like esterase